MIGGAFSFDQDNRECLRFDLHLNNILRYFAQYCDYQSPKRNARDSRFFQLFRAFFDGPPGGMPVRQSRPGTRGLPTDGPSAARLFAKNVPAARFLYAQPLSGSNPSQIKRSTPSAKCGYCAFLGSIDKINTRYKRGHKTTNKTKTSNATCASRFSTGTPGALRTHGLQSRSLTLYPTELRAHISCVQTSIA